MAGAVIGVLLGVAVLALGVGSDGAAVWPSLGPPLAAMLAGLVPVMIHSRRQQAAIAASRDLLVDGRMTEPVTLSAEWGSKGTKVANRLRVRRADTGEEVGFASVAAPGGRFDPRGVLAAHGTLRGGEIVALDADDDRTPLVSTAPITAIADAVAFTPHPCSDAINGLLGWNARPGEVVSLPPELAEVAWTARDRQQRIGLLGIGAIVALPVVSLVLGLGLVAAVGLTVVVWGAWLGWLRWGWHATQQPVIRVLEEAGFTAADARFVSRALVATSLGLGAPPDPKAPAAAATPVTPPPPVPGWGTAPQATAGQPAPPMPAGAPLWPGGPEATRSQLSSVGTLTLIIGLGLVVAGALLYATASPPPETIDAQATVVEVPTASGGVLLDVPQGVVVDGVIMRQVVSWDAPLDPDGVRVGDEVTVHLDPACICNPSLDDGEDGSRTTFALVLVGIGLLVAIGGRFVPPAKQGQ